MSPGESFFRFVLERGGKKIGHSMQNALMEKWRLKYNNKMDGCGIGWGGGCREICKNLPGNFRELTEIYNIKHVYFDETSCFDGLVWTTVLHVVWTYAYIINKFRQETKIWVSYRMSDLFNSYHRVHFREMFS